MNFALLFFAPFLGSAKNIASKTLGSSSVNRLAGIGIVTAVCGIIIFGVSAPALSDILTFPTVFIAALYGLFSLCSQVFYILSLKRGSVAVSSLIYSCGFIIPTLFAAAAYGEKLTAIRIICLIAVVFSILLISGYTKSRAKQGGILLAVIAMLTSGAVGVMQKVFVKGPFAGEIDAFLFTVFLFMLVFGACLKAVTVRLVPQNAANANTPQKKYGIFILYILLATITVFCNKLNTYLSGVFDGVVFFPVVNGGVIALSALFSRLIYKEIITPVKQSGIIICIASIIIIAL